MSGNKYLTEKQCLVNRWIQEIGFLTEMEVIFGKYCVDILVPELGNLAVEIDGPQHYRKEMDIRDKYLIKECGLKNVLHFPVNIEKKEFLEKFREEIG